MQFFQKQLTFNTQGNKPFFFEIRQDCRDFLKETGVTNGILVVQSPHTTCGVFFEEMDHDTTILGDYYLNADLYAGLNKIFPKELIMNQNYSYPGPKHLAFATEHSHGEFDKHRQQLLNGDAHLKSTLIGASKTFIIKDGNILTGDVGYIYFVDFDSNKPRVRKCNLCIIGE